MITMDEAFRLSGCHLGMVGDDPIVRTNNLQLNYENMTLSMPRLARHFKKQNDFSM